MNNVLVTGANGFIGSWLVKKLIKENINVYAVIKSEQSDISSIEKSDQIKIIYCDLDSISELHKKLKGIEIDTVYHLAWDGVGGNKRSDYHIQLNNVKTACDCMNSAAKLGCKRFLCAGTITEKIAEKILSLDTAAENNIYAISKCTTHNMLKVLSRKLGIQLVWMQLGNAYGPYNTCGNIVNYILEEFEKGNTPEFTSGEQPYDLIYVEDLVKAMYLLGKQDVKAEKYYIGSGEPNLLKHFLLEIRDIYPGDVQIDLGKRPDDGLVYEWPWFDVKSLVEDTGFNTEFTLKEGIQKTLGLRKLERNG